MIAHGCVRFHLNPEFRNKRGRGGARKISKSGRRVVANGEEKIEFNRPEPRKEKQRRATTVLRFGRVTEGMAETSGGVYTARGRSGCEFHSISRPLTIERVRSSVCTQDISMERSFVEVLRNVEKPAAILSSLTPWITPRASFFPYPRFLSGTA